MAHLKRLQNAKKQGAERAADASELSTTGNSEYINTIQTYYQTHLLYFYLIAQASQGLNDFNATHRRNKSASSGYNFETAEQEEIDGEPDLGDVGDFEYRGHSSMNDGMGMSFGLQDEPEEDDPSPNEDADEDGGISSREYCVSSISNSFVDYTH